MDRVFARYVDDLSHFHAEPVDREFGRKHDRDALRAACAGIGLYARRMMNVEDRNLGLAMGAFEGFMGR